MTFGGLKKSSENYNPKIVVRHWIFSPPFFVSALLGNRLKSVRHFCSFFEAFPPIRIVVFIANNFLGFC